MKKLLTITLAILMIGSIATGCGKKNVAVNDTPIAKTTTSDTNAETTTTSDSANNAATPAVTQKSSDATTSTNTVTTKTPAVVKQDTEAFYGEWKINKQIAYGPASIYSNDDIKKIVGTTINYSKVKAVYGTVICQVPYYKKTSISSTSFETSNKMKFSTLGITSNSVDQITVYTSSSLNEIWDSIGSVFYLKDQNTLILFNGGVYFELTKVIN